MIGMRGWSFSIGRFLGVDIRIHTFFILLLVLAVSYGSAFGSTGGRGFALWLLLLLGGIAKERLSQPPHVSGELAPATLLLWRLAVAAEQTTRLRGGRGRRGRIALSGGVIRVPAREQATTRLRIGLRAWGNLGVAAIRIST